MSIMHAERRTNEAGKCLIIAYNTNGRTRPHPQNSANATSAEALNGPNNEGFRSSAAWKLLHISVLLMHRGQV